MLASQRQERILDRGPPSTAAVRVSDLVELLGVSDMTIRRDIETLARAGAASLRVHGGATAVDERSSDEPGFAASRR